MTGVSEVAAAFRILEGIKKAWNWVRARKNKPAQSIAFRFIQIFEAHGIHRNQIPRFFGHGLTLQDVQSEESLIARLDETILSDACSMFAVRRQWLDGADTQVYPRHDFYKDLDLFARWLENLIAQSIGRIDSVLLMPEAPKGDESALLLFNEPIGFIDDKEIYRTHLCPFVVSSYWKCRGYIAACVSMSWKRGIYVRGRRLPTKEIESYVEGMKFLIADESTSFGFSGTIWYPEDMALKPEIYLKDIHPELNNFGLRSALSFWLELESSGVMNPIENAMARPLFERELSKYQH